MARVRLGTKNVGDIVKIGVNGTATDFIVVHQGNPDASVYDESCNGTWLLAKNVYTTGKFGGNNNYGGSSVHSYLNNTFYELFDSGFKELAKQVKIPYTNGTGYNGYLTTGASGLSTKVFLLSAVEVGFTSGYFRKEGAKLSYFSDNTSRVALGESGKASDWFLRSPNTNNRTDSAWAVWSDGTGSEWGGVGTRGIRPALILSQDIRVSEDGTVSADVAPTVTTNTESLGEKNAAFAFRYTVSDEDGESLTVTEKLDGRTTKTRTDVASDTALTFELTNDASEFQKILNGSHALTVEVSDGTETTSASANFTKAVHAASVTLAEPLAVDGDITVAVLQVMGSIPDDAVFKAEVTNNAKDAAPVWQDATTEVQKGTNIVFANSTATNGAAFNFRVSVERGESGEGGYIEAVTGAFE